MTESTNDPDAGDALAWLASVGAGLTTLATIWATVDLARAARAAGLDGAPETEEDPFLGARVAMIDGPDGGRIALAEPSTEGRLAATLARHDEGIVGRYVRMPTGLAEVRRLAEAAGVPLSRADDGPFGRSVLVLGAATGPHTILAEGAAVPSIR